MARLTSSTACRSRRENRPPTRKFLVRPSASRSGVELLMVDLLWSIEMAAHEIVATWRVRLRWLRPAVRHDVGAARVKAAAAGRVAQVRRVAGDTLELLPGAGDGREGHQQPLAVGVLG